MSSHSRRTKSLVGPTVPATIGLAEAALILGIHKTTSWTMCREGTFPLPVIRIGARIRVVKVHIQQFLETGEPVTFESATRKPVALEPDLRR
jgi:predicted DNA-binding transcriptional regulator AlpA